MTVERIAAMVMDACEQAGVEHMVTGAFAHGMYGIPRSTKDVDVVVSMKEGNPIGRVVAILAPAIVFSEQIQFDTLTWGKRQVGTTLSDPPFKVELFELFDDAFVLAQFQRKRKLYSSQLQRTTWLPSPEDVVVQKLRWGRSKDLDDARDVLAVQGPESLDMSYIQKWCRQHGTSGRLRQALVGIPVL
jgi:hypothetical protein